MKLSDKIKRLLIGDLPVPSTILTARSAKKEDLLYELHGKKSFRELLIEVNGSDVVIPEPDRIYRDDNQIEFQAEWHKDVETDKLIKSRQMMWTYYPTGEVDEIFIVDFDGKEEQIMAKTIKHYLNGKNPTVLEEK